jgi:hypothetical protein
MTAPLARRNFVTGLISLVAAPAIVRAGSLMPVRVMVEPVYGIGPMMPSLNMMDIENYGARQWIDWARNAVLLNKHPKFPRQIVTSFPNSLTS